jgi:hypothetical protein
VAFLAPIDPKNSIPDAGPRKAHRLLCLLQSMTLNLCNQRREHVTHPPGTVSGLVIQVYPAFVNAIFLPLDRP